MYWIHFLYNQSQDFAEMFLYSHCWLAQIKTLTHYI